MSGIRGIVDTVHLGGLKIVLPPGDARRDLMGAMRDAGRAHDEQVAAATPAPAPSTPPIATPGSAPATAATPTPADDDRSHVIIDHLETHDSQLTILRRKPGHAPLLFAIHDLRVDDVGFGRAMPFYTTLTNPVPAGEVETSGTIGPWQRDDPTGLPITGKYAFTLANLDTINGISGTLSSTGTYDGQLGEMVVNGETETPDFNLDLGGKPVPLKATFKALVDARDGTTRLERVDATLFHTPIVVRGSIVNLPGAAGRDINLDVEIVDGRIEDLLKLSIDSPEPLLSGDVRLHTSLLLPPGTTRLRSRLKLAGRFDLGEARFSDGDVQKKLEELSRRSQGKNKDAVLGRVMTNLDGTFQLSRGVLSLSDLSFQVPGAAVLLDGTYAIDGEALDFQGQLRMQATVSKAIGGFKSIFIKPFDFIFRKDGAGAVIPISITGTRAAPKMGVKMFGKKK
jgi:hypothetical protein